jgi:hypothetical protein
VPSGLLMTGGGLRVLVMENLGGGHLETSCWMPRCNVDGRTETELRVLS